ncbi:hypothetical protein BDZ94DRAFT_1311724 [Collybia nuda]|uniref:Uncharacterized protein n=1 Tax=Collybia nuda TaxID=64659 RepID=A0A9P6CC21_9AGAR|nr:hypothetical protein BDZ94DRAFT_1311724 [Collybia nuda]
MYHNYFYKSSKNSLSISNSTYGSTPTWDIVRNILTDADHAPTNLDTWGLTFLATLWWYDAQVTLTSLQVKNNLAPVRCSLEPSFSWTIQSPGKEVVQKLYQIRILRFPIGGREIWNSGPVLSNKTQLIKYTGPQFTPDTHYTWSVNVSTSVGSGMGYSDFLTGPQAPNSFQVGRRASPTSPDLSDFFSSSSWIWTADANLMNSPAGDRAFRYTFTTPPGKLVTFADILITVDDYFSLYVNGFFVGESGLGWEHSQSYRLSFGTNIARIVLAIRATNHNTPEKSPPVAGVIAGIQIGFDTGEIALVSTNNTWLSNTEVPEGFELPSFDDSTWPPAKNLTKYGGGPWGTSVRFSTDQSNITITSAPTTSSSVGHTVTAPLQSTTLTITTTPPPNNNAARHHRRKLKRQLDTEAKLVYHLPDKGHGNKHSIQYSPPNLPISAPQLEHLPTSISPSRSMSPAAQINKEQQSARQWANNDTGINIKESDQRLEELVSVLSFLTPPGENCAEAGQPLGEHADKIVASVGEKTVNIGLGSGSETSTFVNP